VFQVRLPGPIWSAGQQSLTRLQVEGLEGAEDVEGRKLCCRDSDSELDVAHHALEASVDDIVGNGLAAQAALGRAPCGREDPWPLQGAQHEMGIGPWQIHALLLDEHALEASNEVLCLELHLGSVGALVVQHACEQQAFV